MSPLEGSEFLARCINRLESTRPLTEEFKQRFVTVGPDLVRELFAVYADRADFAHRFEDLLEIAASAYEARPVRLKERDRRTLDSPPWYLGAEQIGAVCYVDRFAQTFLGIRKRIAYLKELGVTYLHLMPFFRSPEAENDGGYAVSSYRDCDPNLGTMDDLDDLARELERHGIALVADFVFNHTSNEHEWARSAREGSARHERYYWTFATKEETEVYQRTLRDIFPEVRKGSFTWVDELKKWVWTSFHSYQWDLNYANPEVFCAMAKEMLALANRGVSVLRLDAVAFVWKKAGTNCENQDEAHRLIRAFQAVVRIVCPSLAFKSEAIVHPDEIRKYIGVDECQLSYNPLLMAELWEASATKEVRLLARSIAKRAEIPEGCAWVNYVRCHDDIGWTFADEDAAELGINGADHRRFLNAFYTGRFPGSFAKGLPFQENRETGDCRISGSAASLAGIERALEDGDGEALERSIRRLKTLYAIAYSTGGVPLLYLGDELAALNDYSYANDRATAHDSRWVHRPKWSESARKKLTDSTSIQARVFSDFVRFAQVRRSSPTFASPRIRVLESGHPSVLAFEKTADTERLVVWANFSESDVAIDPAIVSSITGQDAYVDPLSNERYDRSRALALRSCAFLWWLKT